MVKRLALLIGGALGAVAGTAMAEQVYVKARGNVDLGPFECTTIAQSPNVRRICYDEKRAYVLVSLSGVWYHYCGVPALTVSEWKRASSKGRYYNDHIRSGYDCTPPEVAPAPTQVPAQAATAR